MCIYLYIYLVSWLFILYLFLSECICTNGMEGYIYGYVKRIYAHIYLSMCFHFLYARAHTCLRYLAHMVKRNGNEERCEEDGGG